MRESIGGGWLISFVVLFIVLFSAFLAVSINYTRAFKLKNQIINIIEEYEGYTENGGTSKSTLDSASISDLQNMGTAQGDIYAALKGIGYNISQNVECSEAQGSVPDNMDGFCLKKVCAQVQINGNNQQRAKYYRVTTFINFELPIISINIRIPISGETTTLYYVNRTDDYKCS